MPNSEYIIFEDIEEERYQNGILPSFSPSAAAMRSRLWNILQKLHSNLHSNVRSFLLKVGAFRDLDSIGFNILHDQYASETEFITSFRSLLNDWAVRWSNEDLHGVCTAMANRFEELCEAERSSLQAGNDDATTASQANRAESESLRSYLLYRQAQQRLPFSERDSIPNLTAVMKRDYPIGDSYDYDDSMPLVPGLRQPRHVESTNSTSSPWAGIVTHSDGAQILRRRLLCQDIDSQENFYEDGNMRISDAVADKILLKAIGVEVGCAGFISVQSHALEVLRDVAIRFISRWSAFLTDAEIDINLGLGETYSAGVLVEYCKERRRDATSPQLIKEEVCSDIENVESKRQRIS
uniref:Uncharacterized protein n=1 Tax=Spongospora subterranea TaxID=70186 RepID=A0A0H5RC12_9EUKA|eukprot:CRZ11142.1 hypothetical protein [Spongospora subterranea]